MDNSTETNFSSISADDSDLKKVINNAKVTAIADHKLYSYIDDQEKKLGNVVLRNIDKLAKSFNKKKKKYVYKNKEINNNSQKKSNNNLYKIILSVISLVFIFYIIMSNK